MHHIKWFTALLLLAVAGQNTWAADNSANLTVKVIINAAPCEINNNQNIDVDFGSDVAVTDVAAGLIEKPISYELNCTSMDTTKSLKMTISGNGADFDQDVLKTSITSLGVKIKANGNDYPLNTAFNFVSAETKPDLTALLVQQSGARLETGAFTAGATMTVDYQ